MVLQHYKHGLGPKHNLFEARCFPRSSFPTPIPVLVNSSCSMRGDPINGRSRPLPRLSRRVLSPPPQTVQSAPSSMSTLVLTLARLREHGAFRAGTCAIGPSLLESQRDPMGAKPKNVRDTRATIVWRHACLQHTCRFGVFA